MTDTERLNFMEANPGAVGYATGYRGERSGWWAQVGPYKEHLDCSSLRAAIDIAAADFAA